MPHECLPLQRTVESEGCNTIKQLTENAEEISGSHGGSLCLVEGLKLSATVLGGTKAREMSPQNSPSFL